MKFEFTHIKREESNNGRTKISYEEYYGDVRHWFEIGKDGVTYISLVMYESDKNGTKTYKIA